MELFSKIVSISVCLLNSGGDPNFTPRLYTVVCEDGTVWEREIYRKVIERKSGKDTFYYPGEPTFTDWRQIF